MPGQVLQEKLAPRGRTHQRPDFDLLFFIMMVKKQRASKIPVYRSVIRTRVSTFRRVFLFYI
jgi:hypothetical protein